MGLLDKAKDAVAGALTEDGPDADTKPSPWAVKRAEECLGEAVRIVTIFGPVSSKDASDGGRRAFGSLVQIVFDRLFESD